jgi:predicted transcriptional regulator
MLNTRPCPRCRGTGTITIKPVSALARRRLRAGFTLTALARQLGLSTAYLSQFEHGRRKGTRAMRDAYADLPKKKHHK